jgi:hypothetical protein
MEYTNDDLKVRLVVKDRPTVREQLRYRGELGRGPMGAQVYERLWSGAKVIISEFESEYIALDADLDKIDDKRAAAVIEWTGLIVYGFMDMLDGIPKNSSRRQSDQSTETT